MTKLPVLPRLWPHSKILTHCVSVLYTCTNLNLVITVPADGLAPNGASPSAGTVITAKLDIFFQHFFVFIDWTASFNLSDKNIVALDASTHSGWDKIASILQKAYSNAIYWMKIVVSLIQNSLTFVPKGPLTNAPTLVQIMAWHRRDDEPLSKTMMT